MTNININIFAAFIFTLLTFVFVVGDVISMVRLHHIKFHDNERVYKIIKNIQPRLFKIIINRELAIIVFSMITIIVAIRVGGYIVTGITLFAALVLSIWGNYHRHYVCYSLKKALEIEKK